MSDELPEFMSISRELTAVIEACDGVEDGIVIPEVLGAIAVAVMRLEGEVRALQGFEV